MRLDQTKIFGVSSVGHELKSTSRVTFFVSFCRNFYSMTLAFSTLSKNGKLLLLE